MITLTAKINLLSGDNSALSLGSNNLSGNNISTDLGAIIGVKKNNSNPFILGASKLGDSSTFSKGVDYFIGSQLSDEYGNFETERIFSIDSTNPLNSITISFDKRNNRHPKSIKITKKKTEVVPVLVNLLYYSQANNYYYGTATLAAEKAPLNYVEYSVGYNERAIETVPNPTIVKLANGDFTVTAYRATAGSRYVYVTFEIEVEETYIDDDSIFTISDLDESVGLDIKIDNWNAPNYPLVITGIYAEVNIEINYKNLIAINRSIFDRSDLKLPSWGIISNTGNIEFNDTDGEILDYAEQLLLESGLKCEIKLNNTLVDGASQTIGLFETDEWDYDNDNRVVNVSLKDDLQEWQDINVEPISYDPRKLEHKPFKWLYEHLWALTNTNYAMLSFDELDSETQAILNNTYTQYPLIESGSLWEQWTKLCEVCQLHIYKNNDGVVVCRYNGGN